MSRPTSTVRPTHPRLSRSEAKRESGTKKPRPLQDLAHLGRGRSSEQQGCPTPLKQTATSRKIQHRAVHFCQVNPLLRSPDVLTARLDSLPYLPYRESGTVLSSRCPSCRPPFPSLQQTNFNQSRAVCVAQLSSQFPQQIPPFRSVRSVQWKKLPHTKRLPHLLSGFWPSLSKALQYQNIFKFHPAFGNSSRHLQHPQD